MTKRDLRDEIRKIRDENDKNLEGLFKEIKNHTTELVDKICKDAMEKHFQEPQHKNGYEKNSQDMMLSLDEFNLHMSDVYTCIDGFYIPKDNLNDDSDKREEVRIKEEVICDENEFIIINDDNTDTVLLDENFNERIFTKKVDIFKSHPQNLSAVDKQPSDVKIIKPCWSREVPKTPIKSELKASAKPQNELSFSPQSSPQPKESSPPKIEQDHEKSLVSIYFPSHDDSVKIPGMDISEEFKKLSENMTKINKWMASHKEDHSFKDKRALELMMTTNALYSLFKCMGAKCCYTTNSFENFLQHLNAHKEGNYYIKDYFLHCPYCFYTSSGPINLVEHYKDKHNNCRFQCNLCFYRAAEKQSVYDHQSNFHGKMYGILECPQVFPTDEKKCEERAMKKAQNYSHKLKCNGKSDF